MATEYAEKMAAAVKTVAPALRERGFRKQRNTFNREAEPGLVQMLAFGMGEYLPGDLYGRFTVGLGLWFDEVAEQQPWPKPTFVTPGRCHLTQPLGLFDEPADAWWSLGAPAEQLESLVLELTLQHALPFLDRFASREAVLEAWHGREDTSHWKHTVAPYVIATLHVARGEKREAEQVLVHELRDLGPRHPKVPGILEGAAAMGLNFRA